MGVERYANYDMETLDALLRHPALGDVQRANIEAEKRKRAKKARVTIGSNEQTPPTPTSHTPQTLSERPGGKRGGVVRLSILPITVNRLYGHRRAEKGKVGNRFLTKRGRQFLETCQKEARAQWTQAMIEGAVKITVVYLLPDLRKRDTPNFGKCLYDALEGICYVNDEQIVEEHVYKAMNVGKEGTVIFVEEIDREAALMRAIQEAAQVSI